MRQNLTYIAKYIYLFGGMIIILIGIFIIKDSIRITQACFVPSPVTKFFRNIKGSGVTLGLIMGLLPCMPLLAVLSYIGLISFSWQRCIFYSLIFGLGTLISPLILLVLGAGLIHKILFNKPKIYRIFRLICGFIIVFFGAQLVFQIAHGPIILP